MTQNTKHLILVAGEASGDHHAARLVEEIKKLDPHISFSGLGGQHMKKSGVDLYEDFTRLAVVGFIEVLKHYKEFKRCFNLVLQKVKEKNADAVILIDYPGFNLRLAKELKKQNVKVIYYISPQIWAWKESRVHAIKKNVDQMLVLFEFEKDFYKKYNYDVEFVGHPFIDTVQTTQTKEECLKQLQLSSDKLTLGILPGSREKEIEKMLPIMLKSAFIFFQKKPETQFILIKAQTIPRQTIDKWIQTITPSLPITIVEGVIDISAKNSKTSSNILQKCPYDAMNACDLCLITSGTATLEAAVLNKPMVIIYKTSLFTWLLAKLLVKISFIGLVNIISKKEVVPECVQFQATPKNITNELLNIVSNQKNLEEIKENLQKVKEKLGKPGISQRAAEKILTSI